MFEKLSQNDPRWKDVKIGNSSCTLGEYGCLICSYCEASNWFYGYTKWNPDLVAHNAALFDSNGNMDEGKLADFLGNLIYQGAQTGDNEVSMKSALKDPNRCVIVEVPISKNLDHFMLGWNVSILTGAINAINSYAYPAQVVNVKAKYGSIIGARYLIHKS